MVRRIIRGITKLQHKQFHQQRELVKLAADIAWLDREFIRFEDAFSASATSGEQFALARAFITMIFLRVFPDLSRLVSDGTPIMSIALSAFRFTVPPSMDSIDRLRSFIDFLVPYIKAGKHINGNQT